MNLLRQVAWIPLILLLLHPQPAVADGESGDTLDAQTFTDIAADDWYMDYIPTLVDLSIIEGYPDQSFRPDRAMTAAEFIKSTLHSLSYREVASTLDEAWYAPYIEKAVALELITNGEFPDVNQPITREQMAKLVVKALGEPPAAGDAPFRDAEAIRERYRPYVNTAVELGLIQGYPSDGSFRPDGHTTRAEAAKMLHNIVQATDTPDFGSEQALELEAEFFNRLYQDTAERHRVTSFDKKEALIGHIMEILVNRELVEKYVDRFYKQEEDGLYLIPMDGLAKLREDEAYELTLVDSREAELVQESTNMLRGTYKLVISYEFLGEAWVMTNREVIRVQQ